MEVSERRGKVGREEGERKRERERERERERGGEEGGEGATSYSRVVLRTCIISNGL